MGKLLHCLKMRIEMAARAWEFANDHGLLLPAAWRPITPDEDSFMMKYPVFCSFIVRDDPLSTPWIVLTHLLVITFYEAKVVPIDVSAIKRMVRWWKTTRARGVFARKY